MHVCLASLNCKRLGAHRYSACPSSLMAFLVMENCALGEVTEDNALKPTLESTCGSSVGMCVLR